MNDHYEMVEIPGVGLVPMPVNPPVDDFPDLTLSREQLCLRIDELQRQNRQIIAVLEEHGLWKAKP